MERHWATLADSATAMLQHANCPTKYWGLAMRTVVFLRNRLPTPAASGGFGGVPYNILHGVPNDLALVKDFGCTAYLRLEDRYMDKLLPKALNCMFIGYFDDGPGYKILNLKPANLFEPSMSRSLNNNPRMHRPSHAALLALDKPLHPVVSSPEGGSFKCQSLVCRHHTIHSPDQQPFGGHGRHPIG
jgi:hypothetical protein